MVSALDVANDEYWAVVNTHAHKEDVALDNLARQDFEAYCPKIRRRISHARRSLTVDRPLFPGYVFVRVAPHRDQWRPIRSTVGVRALVCFGDRLGLLDKGLISGLKARERDGVVVAPEAPYEAGQRVKIVAGPFEGFIVTILSIDEKDRLVVLMDLLRNSVRATVPQENVTPSFARPALKSRSG